MPLLERDPNSANPPAHTYPIARGFAIVLLLAVLGLVILRHLFGSVDLKVGTR